MQAISSASKHDFNCASKYTIKKQNTLVESIHC